MTEKREDPTSLLIHSGKTPTDKNNIITSLDIFFFFKSHGLKGLLRLQSSEVVTTKLKMTSSMADVMFVLKEGTK